MDKRDLVAHLAAANGLTKLDAARAVETTVQAIIAAVAGGEPVRISGFGTFEPQHRAPRTARNPQTGEAVPVPAVVAPRFRPSPRFKAEVAAALAAQ